MPHRRADVSVKRANVTDAAQLPIRRHQRVLHQVFGSSLVAREQVGGSQQPGRLIQDVLLEVVFDHQSRLTPCPPTGVKAKRLSRGRIHSPRGCHSAGKSAGSTRRIRPRSGLLVTLPCEPERSRSIAEIFSVSVHQ